MTKMGRMKLVAFTACWLNRFFLFFSKTCLSPCLSKTAGVNGRVEKGEDVYGHKDSSVPRSTKTSVRRVSAQLVFGSQQQVVSSSSRPQLKDRENGGSQPR